MKIDEEQAPKTNEPNSREEDVAGSDRTYQLAVNVAWLLVFLQYVLLMYLVYGPDFWLHVFD